uniref:Uncharacterized protein n=1 Tax=Kalanchoe fedtschenkoi TaxID=63787 RepID=A0A7N0T4T8_KALFE
MSSAFKSTTKRTPIASAADSSPAARSLRRSRSLSRFSRRASTAGGYETPARRGRFVNTSRGAEFSEISLDDLALEIFESAERWRCGNRSDGVERSSSSSSQRRGRSVSRHGLRNSGGYDWSRSNGGASVAPASVKGRRRSVSLARYRNSDTESEVETSRKQNSHANLKRLNMGEIQTPSHKSADSNQPGLSGRSKGQRDLRKLHDGYSSQSSALTDEEPRNTGFSRNGAERTIRTVYAQKVENPIGEDINTGLYSVMRKELRNAVEDIRLELEQAMVQNNHANSSETLQSLSVKKNGAKLDQNKDLLDDVLMDGEYDPEVSKIMSDFLLDSENDTVVEKPQRTRKRSNDKHRMSKELIQEAEQYFDDFISNVEDTDLSSFEGEKSDCGSYIGRVKESSYPVTYSEKSNAINTPGKSSSTPVEMDGVVLPWLQWETSNDDTSPASCNIKKSNAAVSSNALRVASQDENVARGRSNHTISRSDSCSPIAIYKTSSPSNKTEHPETSTRTTNASYFDMDDYIDIARNEELMFETWKQQSRISNGSLHLCSLMFI